MTVRELIEATGWEVLVEPGNPQQTVSGGFAGDLLSWVMGHGESGQVWITVQGHVNVAAVAVLKEFSCLVLANQAQPEEEMLQKAAQESIAVLRCKETTFEACRRLIACGL